MNHVAITASKVEPSVMTAKSLALLGTGDVRARARANMQRHCSRLWKENHTHLGRGRTIALDKVKSPSIKADASQHLHPGDDVFADTLLHVHRCSALHSFFSATVTFLASVPHGSCVLAGERGLAACPCVAIVQQMMTIWHGYTMHFITTSALQIRAAIAQAL